MGTEGPHGFEGLPLGQYAERAAAKAAAPESPNSEAIETEINGEKIKIYPQEDGTFNVYIDSCIFSVEKTKLGLEAKNITPREHQGSWRADQLQPLAIQAVKENYFPE